MCRNMAILKSFFLLVFGNVFEKEIAKKRGWPQAFINIIYKLYFQ
jgi:hypothetical protein